MSLLSCRARGSSAVTHGVGTLNAADSASLDPNVGRPRRPPPASETRTPLRAAFATDGFVELRGFLDAEQVRTVRDAIDAAADMDPTPNPLSLGAMRFASNLFTTSAALQALLSSRAVVDVVAALLGPDAWVRWDQAVWKRPGAPAFPLHQDNGYTGLPVEHLQLWFALTDSEADNGGLLVVPGGHRQHLEHRWEGDHRVAEHPDEPVLIRAEAGDAIAFSSLLPHATTPNTSSRDRLAYVAELLPLDVGDPGVAPPHLQVAEAGRPVLRWHADGVLGPSEPPR